MNKQWKKLSSKKILEHPRINVYEDSVELPSGYKTQYIHFGDSIGGICVIAIQDGKVFVQKEYSYPPNDWLYQFPGGNLEAGEAPEEGALRELAEEEFEDFWFTVDEIDQLIRENKVVNPSMLAMWGKFKSRAELPSKR